MNESLHRPVLIGIFHPCPNKRVIFLALVILFLIPSKKCRSEGLECTESCMDFNYSEHPLFHKLDSLCRTTLRQSYNQILGQFGGAGAAGYDATEAWIDCQEKLINFSAIAYDSKLPKEVGKAFLDLHFQWKRLRDFTCNDMNQYWAEKGGYAGTGLILTIAQCVAEKNHLRLLDLYTDE